MKKIDKRFQKIKKEVQSMAEVDQLMRKRFMHKYSTQNSDNWDDEVDRRHTERMKEIVKEIGWPNISKVGEEGAQNAWLLVQHADHDLKFQKKCLELMKNESKSNIHQANVAFLEDRIAVSEGRPQLYGTQFRPNSYGKIEPLTLFEPEKVNERRASVGLGGIEGNQRSL